MNEIRPFLSVCGIVGLFIYFRYLESGSVSGVLLLVLVISLLSSGALIALIQSIKTKSLGFLQESKLWMLAFAWQGGVFLVATSYSIFKELELFATREAFALAIDGLHITMFILLAGFAIGVELGIRSSGRGQTSDIKVVKIQAKNWLALAMLLTTLFSLNFVAAKNDRVYDLSYLKTSKPSDTTIAKIKAYSGNTLKIASFFGRDSDVYPKIKSYLDLIASKNDNITILRYDKDFAPIAAEEFRAARNGQVILMEDGRRQRIDLGESLEKARKILKKFDHEFQKSLTNLTGEKKNVYLSLGHGEMSKSRGTNPTRSIAKLTTLLRGLGYRIKTLSSATGGGTEVPDDADLVLVAGASEPFLPAETEALGRFLKSGGALMALLDVEFSGGKTSLLDSDSPPLIELLKQFGIGFKRELLVNDKQFVRATRKPIDQTFIIANQFTGHAVVNTLRKRGNKSAVVLFQSGYFEPTRKLIDDWKSFAAVKTLPTTFVDLNRNLRYDAESEQRGTKAVAMAAESKNGRVVAIADASLVSDPIFANAANQLLIVDAIRWLLKEEGFQGGSTSEEDIKVLHSNQEEAAIFHVSIFGVPMLLLFMGYLVNRRKRIA